ncbi:hypothetical protein JOF41_005181 [Saccharothrix coeruleofusca]|uniref:hypothetical protein n=1 Tax=Saccharothrix coeruleofusca TaxID=33919 RepID=UPI001AE3A3B8|nr:hypothetical protein [Saccharothrix coeruleofusca]MBP2339003.1 hypothetical protein [Saccharothrix coeruleofusca]
MEATAAELKAVVQSFNRRTTWITPGHAGPETIEVNRLFDSTITGSSKSFYRWY